MKQYLNTLINFKLIIQRVLKRFRNLKVNSKYKAIHQKEVGYGESSS